MAAGELEIAQYAPNALALSVENAGMADVRVIGDATRDGHADYNSRKYMVRADGPIRTVEDLKGKLLATNSLAGAMDTAMRVMLKKHGLEDKRDYQVVELDFPNMFAAVTSGKVDLASISLPFSIAAEKSGEVRTLFTMKDAIGESDMTIMTARAPFIAAHRAALVDFFADLQHAMRWFYDPANRAEVAGPRRQGDEAGAIGLCRLAADQAGRLPRSRRAPQPCRGAGGHRPPSRRWVSSRPASR